MSTVQEAVRRLTIESTTRGVGETTDKLRQLGMAHSGVQVESQKTERATQSMERRLQSIQRQYDVNYRTTQTMAKVERDLTAAVQQGLITQARKNELMEMAAGKYTAAGTAARGFATQMSFLKGLVGGMVLGGLSGLVGGAIGMLTGREFINATAESEKAMTQLEAAVRSTGGAAGFTARELAGMAGDLQKVSTYGDEAIMSAQGLLLTFTRIGREVFPDALEAVLNVSTAMNQDLKSSAVQVGKALNDPVAGLSALSRVGIQFTKDQKEQIKAMQEAGQVTQAQRIILQELEVQFGGSARAARETLGGAITSLKNAWGDLFESTGPGSDRLRMAIERLIDVVSSPATQAAIQGFGTWLFNAFANALEAAQRLAYIWEQMKKGDFSALTINTATPEGQMAAARRDLSIGLGSRLSTNEASRFYDRLGIAMPPRRDPGKPSGDDGEKKANEYERATKSIEKQTEALNIQIATFGQTAEMAARYRIEQELINAAARAGVELGDAEHAKITRMAEDYAGAVAQLERMRKAQQQANEINDAFRDSFKGLVSDFRGELANGATAWEAFEKAGLNALNRLADKLIDMAMNNLWEAAFPKNGGGVSLLGGGGGGRGGLLGGFIIPGILHEGGLGMNAPSSGRYVHTAYFDDAPRFHNGKLPWGPGEMPAIIKPEEEVLTTRDPRHRWNGGGAQRNDASETFVYAPNITGGMTTNDRNWIEARFQQTKAEFSAIVDQRIAKKNKERSDSYWS